MKITVTVNNKPVEIELTDEQVKFVTKKSTKITDRVKTFQDALNELGIDEDDFNESCEDLDVDEIAYRKLKIISKVLNGGWKPDYGNSNEWKYYPYFLYNKNSGFGFTASGADRELAFGASGARLVLKSKELSDYSGKQFEDIWKDILG